MKKQFCTILILALTLILLFVSMVAQAETQKPEFTFIHSSLNPPTHIEYVVNMDFINRVEEKSNGRIKFDFFHSGILGSEMEMVEQMQVGTIATARIGQPLGSLSEAYMVFNLPFLFSDAEHMLKVANSDRFRELTEEKMLSEGIRVLGIWWLGVRDLYTKKPVKKVEDVSGMKLRTWQDKYVVESWKRLGAIPTPLAFGEVYTSLQTGVVDGAEGWAASYNANSFYEPATYLTKIGYINIFAGLCISEKIWQKLPMDLQKLIKESAQENSKFALEYFSDKKNDIYETSRKNGATVIEVEDIEKWKKMIEPVYEDFANEFGDEYRDLINWIMSLK